MLKNNLGYPRIGPKRELKKACENYWAGNITHKELLQVGRRVKEQNWTIQKESGIDLIPCNDFSFYDQVLDMAFTVGAIPERYTPVLINSKVNTDLDLYFAMARGYQKNNEDIIAMEMTKWFDTNYHYLVPEFIKNQTFGVFSEKIINEFVEAKAFLKKTPKPVIIGPVSFLLLGKEKESGFNRLQLLPKLLPVYLELINRLTDYGAEWIQFDEPFLAMDIDPDIEEAYHKTYTLIKKEFKGIKTLLTTYFEGINNNIPLAVSLPISALHIDLVRAPEQLPQLLEKIPEELTLSLGLIDGRNIWKTNYKQAIDLIAIALKKLDSSRLMIAPSCSLLHCPYDLDNENDIAEEIKAKMAFSKQKLEELTDLVKIADGSADILNKNQEFFNKKQPSSINISAIKKEVKTAKETSCQRKSSLK